MNSQLQLLLVGLIGFHLGSTQDIKQNTYYQYADDATQLNHERNIWNTCTSLNVITKFGQQFMNHPGPFGFPKGIAATVPGVVDRNCENPSVPRDPSFCLNNLRTQMTAAGLLYNIEQPVCNRCTPQLPNSFKFEIWKHLNTAHKDFANLTDKNGNFPMAFCLTCYAYAKKIDEAQQGVTPQDGQGMYLGQNYTIPTVPFPANNIPTDWRIVPGTDVRKNNITVTTRIACGRQIDSPLFPDNYVYTSPNVQQLTIWENDIKVAREAAEAGVSNPTCKAPGVACSRQQFTNQQKAMSTIMETTRKINEHVVSFTKTVPDIDRSTGNQRVNPMTGKGEVKAVNGHHEDLMELPLGSAHIVRSSINANHPYFGFAGGIPDGGYIDKMNQAIEGCQAMEYGMVALSPGEVETACYLTPMLDSIEQMTFNKNFIEAKTARESAEAEAEQMTGLKNLRDFCLDTITKLTEAIMYQHGIKTCENQYCMAMLPLMSDPKFAEIVGPFDTICKGTTMRAGVFQEAARFKALAAEQAKERRKKAAQAAAAAQAQGK